MSFTHLFQSIQIFVLRFHICECSSFVRDLRFSLLDGRFSFVVVFNCFGLFCDFFFLTSLPAGEDDKGF